jgi:glycosyltransferase involved in cell wall biosynthesis
VVVVNDGSKDSTAEAIARFRSSLEPDLPDSKLQWTWLQHDRTHGKGAAIRTALAHAECELVVIHDADLEYHPWDLLQMIELFLYEDADAVFGSRFMSGGHKRALFFRHALGNKLLTFLCDLVSDLNLTDMETCYKVFRREVIQSIPLEEDRFGFEPEVTVKIAKRRLRVYEVGISYSGRTYEEGKKIGWKDGVRAFWCMLKYSLKESRLSKRVATEHVLPMPDRDLPAAEAAPQPALRDGTRSKKL